MKVVTVVGARPQFIKVFPVSKYLRRRHTEILVHTGQHYDYEMSKIFFEELDIPEPDYHLGVGSGPHGKQTGKMLELIEKVLMKEEPDIVLVYGDTNSTLAGALAAAKMHIKVAHVEAGLRSFDKSMPEEINRILTDHVSDFLFAPTETAVNNLRNEGIIKGVYLVGDVMVDSLELVKERAKKSKILEELGVKPGEYILATIHRAKNTDDPKRLSNIIQGMILSNKKIIFPIHPRTKKALERFGLKEKIVNSNIKIIEPVSYVKMISLMMLAKKILTDSGGIQKEAYILRKPCITARDTTEWVETVNVGWNILVGANTQKIVNAIENFNPQGVWKDLFPPGASKKIVEIISNFQNN